ncbi:MAG TPA: hypothetical protein VI636_08330 [Candidatus Angelobacter sp.]
MAGNAQSAVDREQVKDSGVQIKRYLHKIASTKTSPWSHGAASRNQTNRERSRPRLRLSRVALEKSLRNTKNSANSTTEKSKIEDLKTQKQNQNLPQRSRRKSEDTEGILNSEGSAAQSTAAIADCNFFPSCDLPIRLTLMSGLPYDSIKRPASPPQGQRI